MPKDHLFCFIVMKNVDYKSAEKSVYILFFYRAMMHNFSTILMCIWWKREIVFVNLHYGACIGNNFPLTSHSRSFAHALERSRFDLIQLYV